jgi:hypothetical protein
MSRRRPDYLSYSLFTSQTDVSRATEPINLLKQNALYQERWSFKMDNNVFKFKYAKCLIYCGTWLEWQIQKYWHQRPESQEINTYLVAIKYRQNTNL